MNRTGVHHQAFLFQMQQHSTLLLRCAVHCVPARGNVGGSLLQIVKVPWLASVAVGSIPMYKNEHAIRAAYTPPEPVPPALIAPNISASASLGSTNRITPSSSSSTAFKGVGKAATGALMRAAAAASGPRMNMQKPDPATGGSRAPFKQFPLRYAKLISGPNDFWPVSSPYKLYLYTVPANCT